jgi:hypothetical protein
MGGEKASAPSPSTPPPPPGARPPPRPPPPPPRPPSITHRHVEAELPRHRVVQGQPQPLQQAPQVVGPAWRWVGVGVGVGVGGWGGRTGLHERAGGAAAIKWQEPQPPVRPQCSGAGGMQRPHLM